MMTKRLASIMLMVVFSATSCVQIAAAGITTAPTYKVDVTQPAVSIGLDKPVAMAAVKSADAPRSQSHANIKMTPHKQTIRLNSKCASCHSTATGLIGVSEGDSVGIRQLS